MIDFNDIWQLLLENGASAHKEEGTRRYWLTLSDEQQTCAFNNISRKLAARNTRATMELFGLEWVRDW